MKLAKETEVANICYVGGAPPGRMRKISTFFYARKRQSRKGEKSTTPAREPLELPPLTEVTVEGPSSRSSPVSATRSSTAVACLRVEQQTVATLAATACRTPLRAEPQLSTTYV